LIFVKFTVNASHANKITEMADLKRTTAHPATQQQMATDEQSRLSTVIAPPAPPSLGKRRRGEPSIIPVRPLSKRGSAVTQKAASSSSTIEVKPKIQQASKKLPIEPVIEEREREDEEESEHEVDDEERATGTGVKRMRLEINRLQDENQGLLSEQFSRETEIRMEVSLEMAMRSSHLLDQLQDLQAVLG
jgi:hypothetical protein